MKDAMTVLFGLFGGLAIFIFGMNMMSESLQKVAGAKMKQVIGVLTKNPVLGVLAGAVATAVLQSSSATTVMVIGFVSAGLMGLPQAISVILGANIGTTITAQIIAFKITDYIYVFVFVGFFISFVAKSEKTRNIGRTIFAFGLLFTGIETMSSVMKPLASSRFFLDMIGKVAGVPVLGVAAGALMTLVVQSSSATIAVLQNFASQPLADGVTSIIGLTGAIPILLGDNIGTTITALLASVGQAKNARRTAAAHCVFNISGAFLFLCFVKPYAALIRYLSPKGPEVEVISRQIANAHTMFNLVMTLIWVPLIWLMVKIVMVLIPDGAEEHTASREPLYLDNSFVSRPSAALAVTAKEVLRCGRITVDMLSDVGALMSGTGIDVFREIEEKKLVVLSLNDRIAEYLSKMFASGTLNEEQSAYAARLMYVMEDISRMAALCEEVGGNMFTEDKEPQAYTEEAKQELRDSIIAIQSQYAHVLEVLGKREAAVDDRLRREKERIMHLDLMMRMNHAARVSQGMCDAQMTGVYSRLLHDIDRMGDVCADLMEAAGSGMKFAYFLEFEGI